MQLYFEGGCASVATKFPKIRKYQNGIKSLREIYEYHQNDCANKKRHLLASPFTQGMCSKLEVWILGL